MGGRDVQPTLEQVLQSSGAFQAAGSFISELALAPALVQNRKQLRVRSFVLAGWPSCCGPRQPAANELGGGPVRHVRPRSLNAWPARPPKLGHATSCVQLYTATSRRAERRGCTRPPPRTWLCGPQWRRYPAHNWRYSPLGYTFRHFGGLTEQVLCDNASPLKISHDRQSGQVVWNPGFETFCRDRG